MISLGVVGSLIASFISTLYFDASQDMSYIRSTLNTITGYGVRRPFQQSLNMVAECLERVEAHLHSNSVQVSGWFDAFFGKIRVPGMELTQFEHELVIIVIRYLTPILLYLLYSRLTITTILLSFRRVKRQLSNNESDDLGSKFSTLNTLYDACCLLCPCAQKSHTARVVLQGLRVVHKTSTVPGLMKLVQEAALHTSKQPKSVMSAKQLRRTLNMLVPPDVVRFIRTFHHGISASKAPLGRYGRFEHNHIDLVQTLLRQRAMSLAGGPSASKDMVAKNYMTSVN